MKIFRRNTQDLEELPERPGVLRRPKRTEPLTDRHSALDFIVTVLTRTGLEEIPGIHRVCPSPGDFLRDPLHLVEHPNKVAYGLRICDHPVLEFRDLED